MWPCQFTIEEIEAVLRILDDAWQYYHVPLELIIPVNSAREKLLRYMADQSGWHGRGS